MFLPKAQTNSCSWVSSSMLMVTSFLFKTYIGVNTDTFLNVKKGYLTMPMPPIERPRLITSTPTIVKRTIPPKELSPSSKLSSELILEQEEIKTFKTGFQETLPKTWWVAIIILCSYLIHPGLGIAILFVGAIISLFIFSSSSKIVLLGRWLGAGILPNIAYLIGIIIFTSLNPTVTTNSIDEPPIAPITSAEETHQDPQSNILPPAEEPVPVVETVPDPIPVEPVPQPAPIEPIQQPTVDINYGTCKAANEAGKGNYIQGQHVEYSWYVDRDKDGIACEFD